MDQRELNDTHLIAMRLPRELPEIEEKIVSGGLNLTYLKVAQTQAIGRGDVKERVRRLRRLVRRGRR